MKENSHTLSVWATSFFHYMNIVIQNWFRRHRIKTNVYWHSVIITWTTGKTGLIARILSLPAKTFLGYCLDRHGSPCFGDSPFCGQPPFWSTSPFSFSPNSHFLYTGREKSLWLCFSITLSPTHRSSLLSAREMLGRHRAGGRGGYLF